jgi:predicted transcriptional regulator
MKTNIIMVAMLFVSLFALSFALAEENQSVNSSVVNMSEIDASLNGSVNGWKIGWQNVKIAFAFNPEKKIQMELKLADMRLIQAKIAAQNNNSVAMEKALAAHERILVRVQDKIAKIDSANDEKGVKKSAEGLVGLGRAIEVHRIKIERLQALLDNENLTDEERSRIELALDRVQNNTAKLQEVQATQLDRIKTRLMAIANLSEDNASTYIEQIQNAQNLSDLKQIRDSLREEHKANNLSRVSGLNGSGRNNGRR